MSAYGTLAEFTSPEAVLEAARRVRASGYTRVEAFTPIPVEGLADALGHARTRLPFVVLAGGAIGAAGGFAMQLYASVIAYPLDVAGRPNASWPAFIPVTFELGVLGAALAAFFGLLAANGLPRLHHPVFASPDFQLATRDRFFLCVRADDPRYDARAVRDGLERLGPASVSEVPA